RISVKRIAPAHRADYAASVRIEQQLVRVETMSLFGSIRAMNAVAVQQARSRFGQIAVPHHVGTFGERKTLQLATAARVEDDEIDAGRVRRVQREVHAATVPGRAERIRTAWPNNAWYCHAALSGPGAGRPQCVISPINRASGASWCRVRFHAVATNVPATRRRVSARRFRTPAPAPARPPRGGSGSSVE